MATSMREQYDRFCRWLGWLNDDREMEHTADVDRDSTTLRDAVRPAAVDSHDDARPDNGRGDEEPATE